MSPKKRPKNRAPHRTSTRRPPTAPPRVVPTPHDVSDVPLPEIFSDVEQAVSTPNPIALLTYTSSVLAALDPREERRDEFLRAHDADADDAVSLVRLCETFMHAGLRVTDALLNVIAELTPDEMLAERIRRSVASRRHATPGWTRRLGQTEVARTVELRHVLRDGDNLLIGVRLPSRHDLTFLVYIDHNLGTVVKDAFVLGQPIEAVLERMATLDDAGETTTHELDHADARARLTEAIHMGAITVPAFETDTWPACRPLLEWVVSKLPEGGTGYERPEWSEDDLSRLTDAFFASSFGRPLEDPDHRQLLGSILWFATDYGPGDPLRWSPTAVEILLADWLPRKVLAPTDYLAKAPDVLRGFVRYCHAERRISRDLTIQTLAAVDEFEPEYQAAIAAPPAEDDAWDGLNLGGYLREQLERSVGGAEALDRLDATPLPDEPFDWSGISDDVHGRVAEVLALVDGCCADLFDVEFRTACRRFLSRIAASDPAIFRGRATARTGAAAVCWVVGQANDVFRTGHPRVKDLLAWFGVGGSLTKRAEPMLRAIGGELGYGPVELGDPALLISWMRGAIILMRESTEDAYGELER